MTIALESAPVATRHQPGDVLPMGALVLMTERSDAGEFLFCRWDKDDGTERWVTWFVARSGEPVIGNYFADRGSAFADFRRRVAGRC